MFRYRFEDWLEIALGMKVSEYMRIGLDIAQELFDSRTATHVAKAKVDPTEQGVCRENQWKGTGDILF